MGSGSSACCKNYHAGMAPTKGKRYSAKTMTRAEFEAKIGKHGYDEIDDNYSGNISKGEWARLFKHIDTNEDGVVDRQEWEAMFGPGSFDNWDQDGDGAVNYKEWCKVYTSKTGKWGESHFVVTASGGNAKGSRSTSKRASRRSSVSVKSGPPTSRPPNFAANYS